MKLRGQFKCRPDFSSQAQRLQRKSESLYWELDGYTYKPYDVLLNVYLLFVSSDRDE